MILGVASPWTERKGLADFVRLAGEVDSEKYAIVLVGLSEKQMKELPAGIIGLQRTDSPRVLAEIYTAADIYVTPSIEETFGMTVAEANACGTFVVVVEGTACMEAVQSQMFAALPQDAPFIGSLLSLLPSLEERCGGTSA